MNCSDRLKNPALLALPINVSANPKRRNLHTFSRAFLQTIISFEFDWLIGLSLSLPIGQSNCFGFTAPNLRTLPSSLTGVLNIHVTSCWSSRSK